MKRLVVPAVKKYERWVVPAGLLIICAMVVSAAALDITIGLKRLSPAWAFNIGEDTVGLFICALLFYGCFSERENADETMWRFETMLFLDACMLFLDLVSWLLEGIPRLRMLNVASYALYLSCIVALTYQFWRYIHAYLALEGKLAEVCDFVMRILMLPALLVCLANLFLPVCFYVDAQGVYYETDWYLLSFAYIPVLAVCATLCILRSAAPLRNKLIIASFYIVPFLFAVFYASSDGAALPDAPLLSIVLMYVVLVADRSKTMASTMTELNMAASIQADMLPNQFPAFPDRKEFDLYATMDPAKEVGGDFYDFFMIGENRLCMVVADVSGKGVPAALFSMIAKTLLKTQAQTWNNPEYVLQKVNALLSENNKESMFVTAWLGFLDVSSGELTYADAGHEKLLLYQDGEWKFMPKKDGVALAMLDPEDLEMLGDKSLFHNQTVRLKPGDAIFQYTDGVTEATDADNELFGDNRLLDSMNSAPTVKPEDLLPHVRTQINAFVKAAPQFDDITMLGLRYNGTSNEREDEMGKSTGGII